MSHAPVFDCVQVLNVLADAKFRASQLDTQQDGIEKQRDALKQLEIQALVRVCLETSARPYLVHLLWCHCTSKVMRVHVLIHSQMKAACGMVSAV